MEAVEEQEMIQRAKVGQVDLWRALSTLVASDPHLPRNPASRIQQRAGVSPAAAFPFSGALKSCTRPRLCVLVVASRDALPMASVVHYVFGCCMRARSPDLVSLERNMRSAAGGS